MEHALTALAGIIVLGVLAQWIAWKFKLPAILLLLVFGLWAGPLSGHINPDALFGNSLSAIVSLAVAIILFEGALQLRLDELKKVGSAVGRIVIFGSLLTWLLGAMLVMNFFDYPLQEALLISSILVVSGPTVILPMLREIRLHGRVGTILRWEGIVIDPVGVTLAVIVFEAVLLGASVDVFSLVVRGILMTIIVGAAFGALGSKLLVAILKRFWAPDYLQNPVALTILLGCFVGANHVQPESGLVSATLMGFLLANQTEVSIRRIVEFKENLGVLLISSLFIVLSARVDLEAIQAIGVSGAWFVGGLVLVVRPLSVFLSTIGTDLTLKEKLFLSAVAPRGIVAASIASLFALELAHNGSMGSEHLVPITFLVIFSTVAIYGLGAPIIARLLGMAGANPEGVMIVGAHDWARSFAKRLKELDVRVILIDVNAANIAAARREGYSSYQLNATDSHAIEHIDFRGIGRMLAMTRNDEANTLAAINFTEIFGSSEVYQLLPREDPSIARHGRVLFGKNADYDFLKRAFAQGATMEIESFDEEFDWESWSPDFIPLCSVNENGKLVIPTLKRALTPAKGAKLLYISLPLGFRRNGEQKGMG